jgi:hypothetical protein
MRAEAETRWLPKRGNTTGEYEDAFYPKDFPAGQEGSLRFAVSDGASEAMLSGQWAEILVKSFCRSDVPLTRASARAIIGRASMAYEAWLKEYLRRREREGRPIQWYEEPGLQAGAFATLLGLSLDLESSLSPEGACKWEAVSLGDSCLFHVREDRLIASFAMKRSADFSQRPVLLSSNPGNNRLALGRLKTTSGTCLSGDVFYLMTDALAAWFLKEHERGDAPWVVLEALPFEELVGGLREEGLLRNDDVTMTSIRVV